MEDTELERRVTRLETLFSQLTERLDGWAKELREDLKVLSSSIQSNRRTDWKTIFGALGIGFGLIQMFIRPIEVETKTLNDKVAALRAESQGSQRRLYDFHNQQDKEIESLLERVSKLEGR